MPQIRLERGSVLLISGERYVLLRVFDDGAISFENCSTGRFLSISRDDLVEKILVGDVCLEGGSVTAHVHGCWQAGTAVSVPTLSLSTAQKRAWERKLAYVKAIVRGGGLQLPVPVRKVMIQQIAERIGDSAPPSMVSVWRMTKRYLASGGQDAALLVIKRKTRTSRIDSQEEARIWASLHKHFFVRNGRDLKWAYEQYKAARIALGDKHEGRGVSLSTFRRVAERVSGYERDRARLGDVAARNKWRHSSGGTYATRPLARVALDHTVLDIYVLDDDRGVVVGRPVVTMLMDEFSGYILSVYISFEGESLSRVAETIRLALTPKSAITNELGLTNDWLTPGMWETLVVDNALAHHSEQFGQIAAELGCDWEFGPVFMPWFKGVVERGIGRLNSMLPREGRPEKGSGPGRVDPKASARMTFSDLVRCIVKWSVDVYPLSTSERNLVCPLDRLTEGLKTSPAPIYVTNLDGLDIITGQEKTVRVRHYGIEMFHLSYRSPELAALARRQQQPVFQAKVRLNRENLRSIWVHDEENATWIQVPCFQATYAEGLSLIQHTRIRKHLKERRVLSGQEDAYLKAKAELTAMFDSALHKGRSLRKAANAARLMGLSSRQIVANAASPEHKVTASSQQDTNAFSLLDDDGLHGAQDDESSYSRAASWTVPDTAEEAIDLPWREVLDLSEPIPTFDPINPEREHDV
ncbi:Mu transposase C-terminal domain-containing protein [Achromobacter mucicolens]|uniref:Mu transposase C-terminal domain-containing protein n=1 Tax=Achromobacter mucicolens TaxID=1389922 RepID=A0ABD4Z2H1_9BURK|nr:MULTISPECIES: Mu transposase C-terminal domain-containing protein [Achromobacter]MDH1181972.1 Mu transposase C-terminal domain-containing protein [Achromobacter mucicolens]WLW62801.1 Mu transposase C-terminal domain-containing protein [Achromobacter aegrifaciens]